MLRRLNHVILRRASHMKTRTRFVFRIDTWTPDGESIVASRPASRTSSSHSPTIAPPANAGQDPSFDLIRHQRANESIFLYAFDLIELNGTTYGAIRCKSARPRSHLSWPRPAAASGSTNISKASVQPSSPMPTSLPSKAL